MLAPAATAHEPGDLTAFRWHEDSRDGTYQIHPDGVTPRRKLSNASPYFSGPRLETDISPGGGRVAFEGGS